MPLTQLLQSLRGTCRRCNQPAGLLRRTHERCRNTHRSGMVNMTRLAKEAAHDPQFDEPTLRTAIQAITLLNYDSNEDTGKAPPTGKPSRTSTRLQKDS